MYTFTYVCNSVCAKKWNVPQTRHFYAKHLLWPANFCRLTEKKLLFDEDFIDDLPLSLFVSPMCKIGVMLSCILADILSFSAGRFCDHRKGGIRNIDVKSSQSLWWDMHIHVYVLIYIYLHTCTDNTLSKYCICAGVCPCVYIGP